VAEVTSNVHEVLLTQHLLQTARSRPEMQAYLIDQQIQQVFIRPLSLQTMHAEFEQITHEIAQEGLSVEISALLLRSQTLDLQALHIGHRNLLGNSTCR
jgi:oligoendopeptidase F